GVPAEPLGAPVLVPLRPLVGRHEVLQLHLLELARAEHEVAWRDLVAERLADLRDPERRLLARRRQHVREVGEDALRGLGSEVRDRALRLDRAGMGLEHEVELARLGERVLLAAVRARRGVIQLVEPEPFLAAPAVDERVGEVLEVAGGLPYRGRRQDGGIEADHVAGSSAMRTTSRTSSTRWNVIASRTASGTSSRSGPLRAGSTTSVRPARWAASTFCFTPPIGSTRPDSVTSPVIPTVDRTGRSVSRLTSAVVIVTPADGPSLGTAPAGKWMWNRSPANASGDRPSSAACERTNDSAIDADSFMTSPSCPVTVSAPPPGSAVDIAVASTNRTSPPAPVTASPA